MAKPTFLLLSSIVLISIFITCAAVDTITKNQIIKDGVTIFSAGETFEFGFFSPGTSSKDRYVGIWYKNISPQTVVWVANTQTPLNNTSSELRVTQDGLQLFNGNNKVIWSTNSSGSVSLVAQVLDTGNLVLLDQGILIWQSFNYPGDTLLPGMRIGVDLVTGKDTHLTSWKSDDDPSAGQYALRVAPSGYPQLFETQDTDSRPVRFGPWNGVTFNGMPDFSQNSIQFVFNETQRYFEYKVVNNLVISRMYLSPDGKIEHLNWMNLTQSWSTVFSPATIDNCAPYSICGPNGVCDINNAPACKCLDDFEPRRPEEWNITDWSSGCQRIEPLTCRNENGNVDVFHSVSGLKLPDTNHSWYKLNMTLGECEAACKRNCSCMAYASSDIRNGGSGCLQWSDDLMDIRVDDDQAQSLFIRMHTSELTRDEKKSHLKVTLPIVSAVIMLSFVLILYSWRRKKNSNNKALVNKNQKQDSDLPFFSLNEVVKATSNFSVNNKLGQGGFGAVYKGVLEKVGEIAVKRLSKASKQGIIEFQNEVICIAKLQHRNLVKLLGYCLQGEEMMLIYEYMPNKSLDFFLFDKNNFLLLDWPQRYHIINGIARGLVYLHQDSRLRIIHRDLKASNILLDSNMNPKISDFGLARMFKEYETEANTNHVVGTLGYISPEYAANGLFSLKSDVFSFGVLVLEIVSGKKNRGFSHQNHHDNLLGHAWRLYKEGKPLELVDVALGNSWTASEVLQSIHVGLSCVQQHADDRPSMSSVVHMLGGEGALPPPKQPGFFTEASKPEIESTLFTPKVPISINKITITELDGR